MRVLLDECVPRKLKAELPDHDCRTVAQMGWAGTKNGALLELVRGVFDVILTVDQRFLRDRDLKEFGVSLIVLRTNSWRECARYVSLDRSPRGRPQSSLSPDGHS